MLSLVRRMCVLMSLITGFIWLVQWLLGRILLFLCQFAHQLTIELLQILAFVRRLYQVFKSLLMRFAHLAEFHFRGVMFLGHIFQFDLRFLILLHNILQNFRVFVSLHGFLIPS